MPPNGRAVSAAVSRTTAPMSADQVNVTMPSAPAFETAAAAWGMSTMGAWTIGCSIPSISHTGVLTAIAPSMIFAGQQVSVHYLACLGSTYDVGFVPGERRSQP